MIFRYALVDLAGYKEGKIGMRWRTESEVFAGKGQLICASIACHLKEDLHSYEVPFKYEEGGIRKMELVKVRTCIACSKMMFFKKLSLETEKQQQQAMQTDVSLKKRKSTTTVLEDEVIEIQKPKVKQKVIDLSTNDREFK